MNIITEELKKDGFNLSALAREMGLSLPLFIYKLNKNKLSVNEKIKIASLTSKPIEFFDDAPSYFTSYLTGRQIKMKLQLDGYTIKQIAKKTKTTVSNIYITLNKDASPRVKTLLAWAKALKVDISYFEVNTPTQIPKDKYLSGAELKEKLRKNGYKASDIVNALGITRQSFYYRLRETQNVRPSTIASIAKAIDKPMEWFMKNPYTKTPLEQIREKDIEIQELKNKVAYLEKQLEIKENTISELLKHKTL